MNMENTGVVAYKWTKLFHSLDLIIFRSFARMTLQRDAVVNNVTYLFEMPQQQLLIYKASTLLTEKIYLF